MARQPWEDDEVVTQPARVPVVQITPPNRQAPLARPDQARGEASQADLSGYEASTRPGRDAANDARQADQLRLQQQQQRFTQQQQILNSWSGNPQIRGYQDARTAYTGLRNLQRDPNGVNAVATIFAFMKALDPGSTVREGEQAQAQNSAGIPASIVNAYNAALSGDGLSETQRREMVEAAADQLEARARTYNELTYRAREQLRGIGVPINDVITQMPFSGARGSRGYELENRQRQAYGIREQLPDPEAIARGEGASVNTAPEGFNRSGIPQGNLPEGQHVEFAMDELSPSRLIGNATGTPSDAAGDLQFTPADLSAMEAWMRAHGEEGTTDEAVQRFNAFIAQLPPNPNWQGPHAIRNSEQLLSDWRERGHMFEGQTRITPPDISRARGQGGAVEGADAFVRGAADIPTMGTADEFSAGLDTLFGGGTYAENLRRQRGVDQYDEENHPVLRTEGQLVGSLALPTGIGGVGRSVAQNAIRQGLGRTEAVAMARTAMARRMAMESAAYGGAHGFGSGEGDILDRAAHAAVDAAIGGVTGRALPEIGAFDRAAGLPRRPPATPSAATERPPLIDPVTEGMNRPLDYATPAERIAAAQRHGIDLPLDAAGGRTSAIVAKGLDITPGAAGVMEDARRGPEAVARQGVGWVDRVLPWLRGRGPTSLDDQVTRAADQVASGYGGARTLEATGAAAQRGAQGWIDRTVGTISRAYNAIPIPRGFPAALDNTRAALESMTDVFRSNPRFRAIFQNSRLRGYLEGLEPPHSVANELGDSDPLAGVVRTAGRTTEQQPGGLSWEDLKHFRSIIGEEIGAERFSDSPARSQLRGLYAALSEDMRATAQRHGPDSLRRFERANNLNREVEDRIENHLVRILGDDARNNPEAAARAIQTIATSGRGSSNLGQLAHIRSSTIKNGEWNEVASGLVRLQGQPLNSVGREFNPGTFVQNYADMAEGARNLLYGGSNSDLRQALDGFVAVNQRLAGANSLRNTSNTALGITGASAVGTAGSLLWNPLLALKGAGLLATTNGIARVWTNPAFVRWATGYTKMIAGAARASQEPTEEAIGRQRDWLLRVARSSPAIAAEVGEVADQLFPPSTQAQSPTTSRGSR